MRGRLSLPRAFGLIAVVTGVGALLGGWLISSLEPERFESLGQGLWWAIATITTVGYGDFVPVSGPGRVVGSGLMLLGIAALAFVTATLASIIVGEVRSEEELIEREESELLALLGEVNQRLERLERVVGSGDGTGVNPPVRRP